MIYLLPAIGQPLGGSSTVHIYTQTSHRTTQTKQYIEQHKKFGRMRTVPCLCELYPGICLTTEEKERKILSQVSGRLPVGTMKIYKQKIRIHRHNNKNTLIKIMEALFLSSFLYFSLSPTILLLHTNYLKLKSSSTLRF